MVTTAFDAEQNVIIGNGVNCSLKQLTVDHQMVTVHAIVKVQQSAAGRFYRVIGYTAPVDGQAMPEALFVAEVEPGQ